jgi:hypothetical protein
VADPDRELAGGVDERRVVRDLAEATDEPHTRDADRRDELMRELPAQAAVRRSVDPARARHTAVVAGGGENDVAVPRIDSEVIDVRERKGPRRSRAADDRWLPLRVPPRLAPVVRAPDARVAAEIRPPAVG